MADADMDADATFAALEAELSRRRPIASRLRQHLIHLKGGVPSSLRLQLWRNLLGLQRAQLSSSTVQRASLERASKQELENQRVIHADVLRTRAHDPLFQKSETQQMLEQLLSYWCQRKGSRYKQGLNEVLAPFVFVAEDAPASLTSSNYTGIIFELFYAFVDLVLPSMFVEEDFASLQVAHTLFPMLLRFHDAELAARFNDADLTPELYSTPWFLTAFSHCAKSKDEILVLWDHCLLRNLLRKDSTVSPALFLQFVGLALLTEKTNRARMLQADSVELPAVVVKLPFGGSKQGEDDCSTAQDILVNAEKLLAATPSSFFEIAVGAMQKREGGGDGDGFETDDDMSDSVVIQNAAKHSPLPIRGHEVARWLLNEQSSSSENQSRVRFFFLDVRDADEYHFQGHFAMSFHVDPLMLQDKHHAALCNSVAGFKDMSDDFCLCILFGRASDNARKLASRLHEWNFNRVGQSCFGDISAELEGKPGASAAVLKSSDEEAECAQVVLRELLSQAEKSNLSTETKNKSRTPVETEPAAPSAPSKSTSLLLAKSLAEKGASALVGGISGLLNRVAPQPTLLSPLSWKIGTNLRLEEMHQDGFVPFQVQWVGPSQDNPPKEQMMIVTPSFLVFVDAGADATSDGQSHLDPTTDKCSRVINKYSLARLRKISSRKKEPRMLIITFSEEGATGEKFKIGFLTRDQEQNKFAIGLIKTHFIRITQVEK